jgi:hypothetical protein
VGIRVDLSPYQVPSGIIPPNRLKPPEMGVFSFRIGLQYVLILVKSIKRALF